MSFISEWYIIQKDVHEIAKEKGWWEIPEWIEEACQILPQELSQKLRQLAERNDGEIVSLLHSEISEYLEALREGSGYSQITNKDKIIFLKEEIELADEFIRCMDLAEKKKYRLPEAILAKIEYNRNRPKKHGKKF